MSNSAAEVPPRQAQMALSHMEQALALLDELQIPVEVAGHLDLAIHRLRESLPLVTPAERSAKSGERED